MHSKDSEVSAWIDIESVTAQEYNPEILEDGKIITCWISSQTGKKFSVHFENTSVPGYVDFKLFLDGTRCGGSVQRGPGKFCKDYIRVSPTIVRPFLFSPLELTGKSFFPLDDDRYLESSSRDIGTIKVEIWRIVNVQRKPIPDFQRSLASHQLKVHERSKKSGSHQTTFGEGTVNQKLHSISCKPLDDTPFVTFIFKYRPLDILRANGIAPTPRPKKRKAGGDSEYESHSHDDSDADEVRALEERLSVIKAKRAKKDNKVKREPINTALATGIIDLTGEQEGEDVKPFISGQVIDLT